jgi:hypothetical protein
VNELEVHLFDEFLELAHLFVAEQIFDKSRHFVRRAAATFTLVIAIDTIILIWFISFIEVVMGTAISFGLFEELFKFSMVGVLAIMVKFFNCLRFLLLMLQSNHCSI